MPRTFQGRLTGAFVAVIALTLILVSALVLNRLDDYFTNRQQAELKLRADTIATYVQLIADTQAQRRPVVGLDNTLDGSVVTALDNAAIQQDIADAIGQADVTVQFGQYVKTGETSVFVPAINGTFTMPFDVAPKAGQTQETSSIPDQVYSGGDTFSQYAFQIGLAHPYTYRATAIANVTGLLLVIALFALGLAVLVSAALARRFTTPLRQLTEASRALAEGDLSQRVPAAQMRSGSSELVELAVQFNSMADRVEESVEIIRRDRDRSRDFLADVSHELRTPLAALRTFNDLLKERAGDDPELRTEFLEFERPADRTPRLAGPEPPGALQARFRARPARPAARRPAGGRRDRGRAKHRGRPQARRAPAPRAPRGADPHPSRPAADRPGRGQPRRQRRQVHRA